MLAGAIVLAVVLYLVDKNQKWAVFAKVVGVGCFLAVLIVGGIFVTEEHNSAVFLKNSKCADKVRSAYPGSYDDLADDVLVKKVETKYPNFCTNLTLPAKRN